MINKNNDAVVLGNNSQLFIGNKIIESLEDCCRVVNSPKKYFNNPVLSYDKYWEGNSILMASLIHDKKDGFRMWYEAYRWPGTGGSVDDSMLCYAESHDGINWEKPELGIILYEGSDKNNIVFFPDNGLSLICDSMRRGGLHTPTVIKDNDADSDQRYKLFYFSHSPYGIRMATSPEGRHWNISENVLVKSGDRCSAFHDYVRNCYTICTRVPGIGQRSCGLWESIDCIQWEFIKEALHADEQDLPGTQLYGMVNFIYSGMYLGFLEMFHPDERILNTQLIYSYDGLYWERCPCRSTFLDHGPLGDFDYTWAFPVNCTPIVYNDKLYIYYIGQNTWHGMPNDPVIKRHYSLVRTIGLSILRLDGFISINALNKVPNTFDEGIITTKPVCFSGTRLHINAEAMPGYVIAEILDINGNVIQGYEKSSCIAMNMTDSIDYLIRWRDKEILPEAIDYPVKIKFYLRGSRIFSFKIE